MFIYTKINKCFKYVCSKIHPFLCFLHVLQLFSRLPDLVLRHISLYISYEDWIKLSQIFPLWSRHPVTSLSFCDSHSSRSTRFSKCCKLRKINIHPRDPPMAPHLDASILFFNALCDNRINCDNLSVLDLSEQGQTFAQLISLFSKDWFPELRYFKVLIVADTRLSRTHMLSGYAMLD